MYRYADQIAFHEAQPFFKGNLHCHSTVSDGRLTHAELISLYKDKGYAFLCFSDHEVFTDLTVLDTPDFISLPGVEWSCNNMDGQRWAQTHHMHGIAGTAAMLREAKAQPLSHGQIMPRFPFEGENSVQAMRSFMADRGCLTMYNHPLWSCTSPENFGLLHGYTALEIYNFSCDLENHTAFADVYWDQLLSKGARIWGIATDDNHNKITPDDSCGGWISVNAPALSRDALLQAIGEGCFYASSGPVIRNYGIADMILSIACEPVHHINFIAGGAVALGRTLWGADGEDSLTAASFALSGQERYVRIECVTKDGKTAWSNPLFPFAGCAEG